MMDERYVIYDGTEALAALRALQRLKDYEAAHAAADDVLCALLDGLGQGDVVEEFRALRREYA